MPAILPSCYHARNRPLAVAFAFRVTPAVGNMKAMLRSIACLWVLAILPAAPAPLATQTAPATAPTTQASPATTPATRPAAQPALLSHVDHRVELMCIIFRLAGNPEYNRAAQSSYVAAVDQHFAPYRDHPAVKMARRLRETRGVSFDAVAGMAVHVSDAVQLKERISFDHPDCKLDQRWQPKEAREFLKQARKFVKDTGFEEFMTQQEIYFTAAAIRMNELVTRRAYLTWFDSFFGPRPNARYEVLVGLLNGGSNYGCSVRLADGSEDITPVIGVWRIDSDGLPVFRDSVIPTLIHEFCHPYVNPTVEKFARHLENPGRRIHATCAEVMRQQAYGHWQTVICESLVRASVVRYVRANDSRRKARAEIREQHDRGFVWVEDLSNLLEEYEQHRDQYPTLEAFMPRVVTFFDEYAGKIEAQAAKRPKVVSMIPANGADDVDPALKAMRITFDRPMQDNMWSIVGGGPNFPELTGKPAYDKARKVLTVPMKLKPGWRYELWLNRNQFNAFRSADGVPLDSVAVTFKTRGSVPETQPQPDTDER